MSVLSRDLLWRAARVFLERRFDVLDVGEGARVNYWKIRPGIGCSLRIGCGAIVEARIAFEKAGARVEIGDRTFVGGAQLSCASAIEIGSDVLIAWGCVLFDHGSHALKFSERSGDVERWRRGEKDWSSVLMQTTSIGDKVWIGYGSIVLPGVTIGEGSIVGAGSVVTRDVPPWTIVAGNPARMVRDIREDER